MDLPRDVAERLTGRALEPISLGESGAHVWRCTADGQSSWYLKAAPLTAKLRLDRDAECMRWMSSRGVPVPLVHEYTQVADTEYLLMEEAIGVPASAPEWNVDRPRVARALGRGLATLHATDATGCPFDRRIARQLEEARIRLVDGHVREDDFDASRLGRAAADLFAELLATVPPNEDLVLVHGDFCLPNVLLDEQASDALRITGLIDCGRAGIGDRHQDLALAIRSLADNLGPEAVSPFLHAYGRSIPDPATIEFFTVLDEFF